MVGQTEAQDISRLAGGNPKSPIAEVVTVPPGYTTYYISGTPARAADPNAAPGSPQRMRDTHQQTVAGWLSGCAGRTKLRAPSSIFLTGSPVSSSLLRVESVAHLVSQPVAD